MSSDPAGTVPARPPGDGSAGTELRQLPRAAREALVRYAMPDQRSIDPGCSAGQMVIARSSKAMRSRWRLGASVAMS